MLASTLDGDLIREGKRRFSPLCASNALVPIWGGLFDTRKPKAGEVFSKLDTAALVDAAADHFARPFAEYVEARRRKRGQGGILSSLPNRPFASAFLLTANFAVRRADVSGLLKGGGGADDVTTREVVRVSGRIPDNMAPPQEGVAVLQSGLSSVAYEDVYAVMLVSPLPPTPVELEAMLVNAVSSSSDFAEKVNWGSAAEARKVYGLLNVTYSAKVMLDPRGENCFPVVDTAEQTNVIALPFSSATSFASRIRDAVDPRVLERARTTMGDVIMDLSSWGEAKFWRMWSNPSWEQDPRPFMPCLSLNCKCHHCVFFSQCIVEGIPFFEKKPAKICNEKRIFNCQKMWE